ncbi:MAG: efflux RND transporter permease subunit, partial [Calditrichaeota bacterium]|nr:efflux RND transporter permease subunit [Calditrichota bacterium]
DAIVVGENVFTFREIGKKPQEAANRGVSQVMTPVVFSVMTTVAAFSPLLFVDGFMGKIMFVIPVIVISVLLFSLMESLIILPSHLAGVKTEVKFGFIKKVNHFTERIDARLDKFINGGYQNFLLKVLHNRYLTLTTSIAVLLVTFGLLAGGILKFAFFPDVEADNMIARLALPKGASIEQTRKVVEILENAAFQVEKEFNATQEEGSPSLFKHMYSVIGEQPMLKRGPGGNAGINPIQSNISEINIELIPSELRDVTTTAMVNRWRELVGEIPGVESLSFQSSIISSGADIAFELSALDFKTLNTAVEELKFKLSEYNGVREIRDDFEEGKYELKIKLKPSAAALGLTLADLARQARAAFYGEEALRIQRGKDEVKVMVRLPEKDRKSLTDVENLRIRAANGVEVPFMSVAEVSYGRGYSQIKRMDGRRIISVTADVDETIANANDINSNLYETVVPELQQKYRGLFFSVGGQQKEQNKAMASLKKGFILALFAIYALLAIPFRSYIQPIIVMLAIPFGFVGAIAGHLLLGFDVSIMSMFGIVALAGIVVNDSLVLVDFINTHRRNDQNLFESVVNACKKRFRPILLTSLTTFFGLLPIILERSTQAKFLIPMAISLGMGVMFATVICLLFVPASVLIVDDITHRFKRLRNKDLPELEHNSADYSYEVEG